MLGRKKGILTMHVFINCFYQKLLLKRNNLNLSNTKESAYLIKNLAEHVKLI